MQSSKAQWESSNAAIGEAQAALAQAQLQLSYTKVVAPVAGLVCPALGRPRQLPGGGATGHGPRAHPRVDPTANFKENQLRNMRPGQPAEIRVDACPGHILHGFSITPRSVVVFDG